MFRRFFIALSLAATILSLAACGGHTEEFNPPSVRIISSWVYGSYGSVLFEVVGNQGASPEEISLNIRMGYGSNIEGAKVCIREAGSTYACGGYGTTSPQRLLKENGGWYVFDTSTLETVQSLRRGERVTLELIIDNDPFIFGYQDSAEVTFRSMRFYFEGDWYTVNYTGLTTTLYR